MNIQFGNDIFEKWRKIKEKKEESREDVLDKFKNLRNFERMQCKVS